MRICGLARRQYGGRPLLQQGGDAYGDVRLVLDRQPAGDARRHDGQPVGCRGRGVFHVVVRSGDGGSPPVRVRRALSAAAASGVGETATGGAPSSMRTEASSSCSGSNQRCSRSLSGAPPAAADAICKPNTGQTHTGQFLPQCHICPPPNAFSTIYMVFGLELCHRTCYTVSGKNTKEASL